MPAFALDPEKIRDISPLLLNADGRLAAVPTAVLSETTTPERALFGHKQGVYGFVTWELAAYLDALIGGRSAIEVGAGHGVLGQALGIPATDSRVQERPDVAAFYELTGQPVVSYGPNVETLDYRSAIEKYQPQVVVASWVTHLYDEKRHAAGGSVHGLDEPWILEHCEEYILIGNDTVHAGKSIWSKAHIKVRNPFVFSRSMHPDGDFIARWRRR